MKTPIDYINQRLFPALTDESVKNKSALTWKDVLELLEGYMYYNLREREVCTKEQVEILFDNYKNELLNKVYHAHSRDAIESKEIPTKESWVEWKKYT